MNTQHSPDMRASILIVDDMPDNLRVLAGILKESGCKIRLLQDGRSVWSVVLDDLPDLILLDILMPDMDGYAVCAQLKADSRTRDIPILFLSALSEPSDKIKAFAVGGADYITKPFHAEEVLARVNSHLTLCRLHRQLAHQNAQLQQEMAERKWTEEALQRSEEKYRHVIENASEAIIVVQDGMLKFFNQRATDISGYSAEELATTPFLNIVYPEDRDLVTRQHQERLRGYRLQEKYAFRYLNKAGDIKWMESNAVLIDWQGRPATLSFLTDITDRKYAEFALQESQRQLQASYQREQQRRQLSDTLREVAAIVGSSLDTTAVLDAMLTQLRQVVTYHHATVTIVEGEQCTVVAGRDEHGQAVNRFTFPKTHYPLNVEALQARCPILVPDVQQDPRWQPGMSNAVIRSFINAPLLVQDRPIGVLGVGRNDDTPYTEDEAQTVFAFASQVAVALENARLYTTARQEILDRQRAEAALRKSFQLQEKIFTSLEDVILVVDQETHTVLLCNPVVERMFGFAEQEVFGESVAGLYENQDIFQLVVEDVRHALDARDVFQAELQMRRKDGSLFLSSQHATELVDEHGERVGILWIIREITEQRRAEQSLANERNLLRTLINNIPMLIYVKDSESRFLLANDATVTSMGMQTQEELIGKTDFDFHPADLAAQYYADERALLESGRALVDHEEPVFDPVTGTMRWLLSTKVPFYDSHGQLAGLVGMNHDITARKEMEAQLLALNNELQAKNAQLAELNASKDKFFSIISHDLRSPFSVMMGQAQLLAANVDRYSQMELKAQLEKLSASADKLYTLLENLLTWSRLQRGAMVYTPEPFLLNEIIEDNLALFLSKAEQKDITLNSRLNAEMTVYADYQMVNTVLRNLVSNALKFTPAGGRITLSAQAQDGQVEITVRDTGVGIAPDDLAKLFRIDTQYTQMGTAGETGTGLGLSLCKDLVEKNGGRIWVESVVGQGATFRFTLPLAQ